MCEKKMFKRQKVRERQKVIKREAFVYPVGFRIKKTPKRCEI
mgnify:CR=1 FL=1